MGRLTLEQEKLLKSFIAISKKGLKEENYEGFKKILRSNNWLPLDPAEEERLARERIAAEKRKKEAEDRRIREEAERRWAEEERRRRQEEERVRRAERARKRKQKKILMVVGILIGVFVIFQVSSFAYSNYKYTLKRNHMITVGDEYLANGDYDNAISSYQSALPLKQSTSKRNQINDLIHNAKNVKYKEINDLLSKIETIIQSNKTSLKYGVMNYDDPKYMIDRVLQLDGENKRAKDFLAQLEKQKRRSRK